MVYTGSKSVANAGTRVALASARTMADWVIVQANQATAGGQPANTGAIYLGDKTVAAANGQILQSGDGFLYPVVAGATMYNLAEIYIDADTNGNAVRFLYGRK